ncbi:MAG: hypothetical protein KH281_13525 [Lachnospiraceae bacterium]|nr:hypothetical protein [Lachnospiraceae bacterium]
MKTFTKKVNQYTAKNILNMAKTNKKLMCNINKKYESINEQIQNIAQKKDTLCRMMYNSLGKYQIQSEKKSSPE